MTRPVPSHKAPQLTLPFVAVSSRSSAVLVISTIVAIMGCESTPTNPAAPSAAAVSALSEDSVGDPGLAARQEKIDVCHLQRGKDEFVLRSVPVSALDNPLAHGDGRVGALVPGMPGMVFDENCVPKTIVGDTIFDNGAVVEQDLGIRFNYAQWTVFDDFVLTVDSIVTSFDWSQFDEQLVSYSSTTLVLFDGLPSPSTHIGTINAVATRTDNTLMLNTDKVASGQVFGFDYSVAGFTPQSLAAGTYFLGIH